MVNAERDDQKEAAAAAIEFDGKDCSCARQEHRKITGDSVEDADMSALVRGAAGSRRWR